MLIEEKYYSELKTNNRFIHKYNHKHIKQIVHVNINNKINEKLYLKFKNIKNKKFYILEKIFEGTRCNRSKKDSRKIRATKKKKEMNINDI